MRAAAVALCIALAGCATQKPPVWIRVDGGPLSADQLEVDRVICRGETQKSNLAGFPADNIGGAIRRSRATDDVYKGCMAQHGWMLTAAQ